MAEDAPTQRGDRADNMGGEEMGEENECVSKERESKSRMKQGEGQQQ